jgi:hypothetical protein
MIKWTLLIFLVPGGGLEPPRPCGLRILSPLRLPISPSGPSRVKGWCYRTYLGRPPLLRNRSRGTDSIPPPGNAALTSTGEVPGQTLRGEFGAVREAAQGTEAVR